MTEFKFNQFAVIINNGEERCYFVKGFEYIDGELYLISGEKNIKHHISNVKQKECFFKIIEDMKHYQNGKENNN